MKQLSNLSYPKPSLMCHLFDSLIKPVMNYGAEVWNYTISANNDSLEIIHRKFCKFALKVSTNSTNLAVYGELGRVPISISRKVQAVKYWHRLIKENEKLPIYLKEAYFLAKSEKLKWYLNSSDIFKNFGLDHPNEHLTINDIKNHFVNNFIHEWKIQLQSSIGKLRLYKKIKNIFCYENYLEVPFYLRNPLTKLRINNHSLQIKTGRLNLPPTN